MFAEDQLERKRGWVVGWVVGGGEGKELARDLTRGGRVVKHAHCNQVGVRHAHDVRELLLQAHPHTRHRMHTGCYTTLTNVHTVSTQVRIMWVPHGTKGGRAAIPPARSLVCVP